MSAMNPKAALFAWSTSRKEAMRLSKLGMGSLLLRNSFARNSIPSSPNPGNCRDCRKAPLPAAAAGMSDSQDPASCAPARAPGAGGKAAHHASGFAELSQQKGWKVNNWKHLRKQSSVQAILTRMPERDN